MGYVPGFEYDVFVSYARVDNVPSPAADRGWVDTFIQILQSGLDCKLGRREARLWIDDQKLRGDHEVNRHIPEQAKRSALLLVILSPGYLASEFCRLELQTFLDATGTGAGRMFVVNQDQLVEKRRQSVPKALRALRGYQFWEPDKNNKPRKLGWPQPNPKNPDDRDRLYYQRVEDVSQDIAEKLEELRGPEVPPDVPDVRPLTLLRAPALVRKRKPAAKQAALTGDRRPAVLLAETTDDLVRRRDEVQRYLQQSGIDVLPAGTYYGLSAADYEQALKTDLAQCAAFVQLLGPEPGRRIDGVQDGFGSFQYAIAQQAQRPILQWRTLELADLRAVEDKKHRQLLQAAEAMPIEEFKLKIVQSLKARTAKPARPSFFFINCDLVDVSEADSIGRHLGGNVDWERPLYEEKPKAKALQESIEARLVDCDGLLIVHGRSPVGWVRAQLQLYRKLRQKRVKEPRVLAVVQLGTAPQLKGVGMAGLQVIGVGDLHRLFQPEF
jgi:TIR domain